MQKDRQRCVYCGAGGRGLTRDHVFPRGLFPPADSALKVQRLTVAACKLCNGSFSDDETHFRFVVTLASNANESATAIWRKKILPSWEEPDGRRRIWDVMALTERVVVGGQDRLKIYPAQDERVLRVIRKSVRGLIHLHNLGPAPHDKKVWADVQRYALPRDLEAKLQFRGAEPEVVEYAFLEWPMEQIDSLWLFRFFQRVTFIASVSAADSHPARNGISESMP
jgi:hypothetical protein